MSQAEVDEAERRAADDGALDPTDALHRRHLLFGWWSLLAFLTLGLVLDALHGLKVGWYLNVENTTRRLMWTLAHTHGTLIGLVHLAFAAAVSALPAWPPRRRLVASNCLVAAGVLMPGGFLLGGVFIYDGDPGIGGLLVPPGGVLLLVAVALAAFEVQARFLRRGAGETAAQVGPRRVPRPVVPALGAVAVLVLVAALAVLRSGRPSAPPAAPAETAQGRPSPAEAELELDDVAGLVAEATSARMGNNPERAVRLARRALAINPDHYGAKYQLAAALELAGHREESLAAWRSFLAAAQGIGDERWALDAQQHIRKLSEQSASAGPGSG